MVYNSERFNGPLLYLPYLQVWRQLFQEAAKISSRAHPSLIHWNRFLYMVFDLPKHGGTYELICRIGSARLNPI